MTEFLTYDLKVAVLIAVFYMFYRLLLARETFHRLNRVVLLTTAVASFVLPLCVITLHRQVVVDASLLTGSVTADVPVAELLVDETPWWLRVAPYVFFAGMTAVLAHTLVSVVRILHLIRHSEQHPLPDGTTLCVAPIEGLSPFSWMRYIVMSRADYEAHDPAILAHERGHISERHSLDVVLVDLLTALQWFNPAMWMLRQDLRSIHEYEADAAVLSLGINARQYQYLLITKAAGIGGYSLANGISHSTLKNRINMMLHKKSTRASRLKLLALLPIVGAALALNAKTVSDIVIAPDDGDTTSQPQQPVKKGKQNTTVNMGGKEIKIEKGETTPDAATPAAAEGETLTFRGVVSDKESSTPIIGAIVKVAGTTLGTVSDREGRFAINAQAGQQLEFAYVGYETAHLTADKRFADTDIHIGLQKEGEESKIWDVVDEMPKFPGGQGELMKFLSMNIKYPVDAHDAKIQGRVIVTFVVDKDGSVTSPKVVRSIAPSLDEEALRVVSAMPQWEPGKSNGKAVRVKYTIPITFRLMGDDEEKTNVSEGEVKSDGKVLAETVVVGYGDDKMTLGVKPSEAELVLDGEVVDLGLLQLINPKNITLIQIEKPKEGEKKTRIIVTTKKK